eukprot:UN10641
MSMSVFDPFYSDPFDVDYGGMLTPFGATNWPSLNRLGGLQGLGNRNYIQPVTDVWETPDAVNISCELPGIRKENVQIDLRDGRLIVNANQEDTEETDTSQGGINYHRRERHNKHMRRNFRVPFETKDSDVDANFDNGLLTVTVKKTPEMAIAASKTSKIPFE